MEFHHNSFVVGISGLRNQIQELIKVSINRMLVLEVGSGLKVGNSSNISMSRTEFFLKLLMKVFPVNKPVRLQVFLLPKEYLCSPHLCSSSLHVRKSPNNFSLVIREAVRTQMNIGLAGAEEGHSAGMVSVEL